MDIIMEDKAMCNLILPIAHVDILKIESYDRANATKAS